MHITFLYFGIWRCTKVLFFFPPPAAFFEFESATGRNYQSYAWNKQTKKNPIYRYKLLIFVQGFLNALNVILLWKEQNMQTR